MAITLSSPNNISSPRGNSLAIYKDALTGKFFAKDIYGKIEDISTTLGTSIPTITTDSFTGDGNTSVYALSVLPLNENYTMVFVEGLYQIKSSYSLDNNIVTFNANIGVGLSIEIVSTTASSIMGWNTNTEQWEVNSIEWQLA